MILQEISYPQDQRWGGCSVSAYQPELNEDQERFMRIYENLRVQSTGFMDVLPISLSDLPDSKEALTQAHGHCSPRVGLPSPSGAVPRRAALVFSLCGQGGQEPQMSALRGPVPIRPAPSGSVFLPPF